MKLNQKGFGAVEVLLSIIAITLIIGVGVYVVNANKDTKNSETAQNTSEATAKTTESSKSKEQAVSPKSDKDQITELLKNEFDTINVTEIIENNARGSAGSGSEGGIQFIAHKEEGKWAIVSKHQDTPGKELGEKYNLPTDWYSTEF